jgi:tRNA nucleotidyltransferase/poly(A) polymerase
VPEHPTTQRDFALDVVGRLRAAGHEALWAGGCVRDQLLGRSPKDYDVATSALPDQVRELFGERRTLAIGAAFGVITVLGKKPLAPVEVATFRTDGDYRDGRRPESVSFTDAQHDAQRRDFTINGLFFDPIAERVVDYVGGVADLEAKIVRAIGDPARRFSEDRLRMLRAVRFAATFGFELDAATLQAIRAMANDAVQVSAERIGAELRRILLDANRSRGVELLAEAELLLPLLPEVAPHATSSDAAWKRAQRWLENLKEPTLPMALAALLYEMIDANSARALGRRLRLSNKETERTAWLLEKLPTVLQAVDLPWPPLQRALVHDGSEELLALAAAILPADDAGLARCRSKLARPTAEWNPPPLVTGDDLMAQGIESGPHFSALLEHLRDAQLEGRLRTSAEAIDEAHRWMKSGRLNDGR